MGAEGLRVTLVALAVGTPGLAALAVAVAALTASIVPAWRAMRTDPIRALRG
jgi:ABC-type lipoprotein release transport system permease subunit